MSKKKKDAIENTGENATPAVAETKAERFGRLAVRRVNDAVKRISRVANLANRSSYEYTDEQSGKIIFALRDALNSVEDAFAGQDKKVSGFTF